ncbi:MAG TPA: hypothetical protein VNO31_09250, partial [Umezawaea sp.]|nr:hypothetical protein [Umezawaea sp.]
PATGGGAHQHAARPEHKPNAPGAPKGGGGASSGGVGSLSEVVAAVRSVADQLPRDSAAHALTTAEDAAALFAGVIQGSNDPMAHEALAYFQMTVERAREYQETLAAAHDAIHAVADRLAGGQSGGSPSGGQPVSRPGGPSGGKSSSGYPAATEATPTQRNEDRPYQAPTATGRRENPTVFPDPVDPGEAPDAQRSGSRIRKDRGAVVEQVDTADTGRVVVVDGLIESIDGKSVQDYVGDVVKSRAQYHDRAGWNNGPFIAVAIDRRTGLVVEAVNGLDKDVIREENLHPLLRENSRALLDWYHTVMASETDVLKVEEGRSHPDKPLRHAEVKAVNELLWARQRQHDEANPGNPTPLGREVLGELGFDPRILKPRYRNVDGRKVLVADRGDPGAACSNCNVLLRDVVSYTGRYEVPPGDYRYPVR